MILLTNDDGIDHPGLISLAKALRLTTGQPVLIVAPTVQRSGSGHAITIGRALRVTPRLTDDLFGFAVDGTPTDCVKIALTVLCPTPPILVVSGINDGPNVGRSLFYSGTVSAALEAAIEGHAALAVSRDRSDDPDYTEVAAYAGAFVQRLLLAPPMTGRVVNLNLPSRPAASWKAQRVGHHGHAGFSESYRAVRDDAAHVSWMLDGHWTAQAGQGDSDAHLLADGHPVLTLLRPDLNSDQKPLRDLLRPRPRRRSV